MIKIELSIRRKRKRKKLDVFINLLKISLCNEWRMKEGVIYQIIGKENIDELFLWNMFVRIKTKRKIRLKPYIFGKIFEFSIEKKKVLEEIVKD
jgi:hypothetical protein